MKIRFGALAIFALSLYGQGEKTLDELTAQIATQPTSALYSARGAEQLRLGNAQLAADDYSQAIRLRLDDPVPWVGRGKAYLALKRYSDAKAGK